MALRAYIKAQGGEMFPRTQAGQQRAIAAIKGVLARNPNEPINVTGYSRGAEAANQVARTLGKDKISVAQLNLIDPVKKFGTLRYPIGNPLNLTVPSNVRQADNYYQTKRTPFPGGAITNESANYRNHDMTDQGVTHNTIVDKVLGKQPTTQPPQAEPQAGLLEFMLDGVSGKAGISGPPMWVTKPL